MNVAYITNGVTQDGFGARMHRVINIMAFTFYVRDKFNINIEYVHTPFSFEGFGEDFSLYEKERGAACNHPFGDPYGEVKRDGYLKRAVLWDKHMNYIGKTINEIQLNNIETIDVMSFGKRELFNDISKQNISNKLYIVKYLQKEFNSGHFDINMVGEYISEIKDKFGFIDNEDNNDIILQIRRKDAILYGDIRYLEDDYYLKILEALRPHTNQYNITVHTQRSGFDSTKYSDWNVVYDDEIEDYVLFKKMASSKVLVVGKTSFSVAAAFLNKNIVVYPIQHAKGLNKYITKEQFIVMLNDSKIL